MRVTKVMQSLTGISAWISLLVLACLFQGAVVDAAGPTLSRGQTVYVPSYNAVRIGDHGKPFPLAATLCIRNTNQSLPITVGAVDYYDSDGKLLKRFVGVPFRLGPLCVTDYFIKSLEMSGGLYPSFLIRWESQTEVTEPVIEAIFVGDRSGQGISFVSRGRVIKEEPW